MFKGKWDEVFLAISLPLQVSISLVWLIRSRFGSIRKL